MIFTYFQVVYLFILPLNLIISTTASGPGIWKHNLKSASLSPGFTRSFLFKYLSYVQVALVLDITIVRPQLGKKEEKEDDSLTLKLLHTIITCLLFILDLLSLQYELKNSSSLRTHKRYPVKPNVCRSTALPCTGISKFVISSFKFWQPLSPGSEALAGSRTTKCF